MGLECDSCGIDAFISERHSRIGLRRNRAMNERNHRLAHYTVCEERVLYNLHFVTINGLKPDFLKFNH